jgi:hypothetical protein
MAEERLTMSPSPESSAGSDAGSVASPREDTSLPPEGAPAAPADGVRLTRLPFGGAVLVDARSLRLVECAEHEADALDRLLATGRPDESDVHIQRLARQLLRAGLLVAVTEPK